MQFASTIKNRTSQRKDQRFYKSLQSRPKRKIVFKKFPTLQKKIKHPTHKPDKKSTRKMTETDDIKMVVTHDRQERQPITRVWQKWRFSAPQTVLWLIKVWFSALNLW